MSNPATPAAEENDQNEIGMDVIALAAERLGVKLPAETAPAKGAKKPAAAASKKEADATTDEVPEREEGETDEDYSARLEEAGIDPAEHIAATETDEERTERLQQGADETDDDYEARLAEEGLTRDDVVVAEKELTEEEKKAAAEKARNEADLKKLPEAVRNTVQGIINKRIGKITAQAKAKETELTTRNAELETQLAEAKEAADGKPAKATVIGTVHPLLFDPSEDAIAKYVEGVEGFEDWAAEHADGYEPTAEEEAKGYKPASAGEIRARLRSLQRERDKIVAQAREALTKRAASEAEAKKIIPAFFDAKSPDYQAARTLLREQPELKRFPDYQLRVAAIVLGRKALADLRTAAAKPVVKPKPVVRASRAPNAGAATKGGFTERKRGGSDATTAAEDFAKAPTRENLTRNALSFLETAPA